MNETLMKSWGLLRRIYRSWSISGIGKFSKGGIGMLAPEFIIFSMLFMIPLVWTLLKILVNHLIDSEPPPIKGQVEELREHCREAA
ncbi:MAG: hypothetical protein K0S58_412 [Nitrospira sp.]|jgi:hypothetical protein|nr:hypothetical protein [Nitrospira sp.]